MKLTAPSESGKTVNSRLTTSNTALAVSTSLSLTASPSLCGRLDHASCHIASTFAGTSAIPTGEVSASTLSGDDSAVRSVLDMACAMVW